MTLDTLSNGKGGTNIYAGTEVHGVYLSTDHGGTWNSTGAGLRDTSVLDLAFLPGGVGGTRILAATEHGVFLSRNNGQSWNAMNNGMGHPAVPTIIVTPRRAGNGRNIFAGTRGTGVFRSTDDGLTWVATGLTNASISAFATVDDGVEGSMLFAALADGDGGVFLSTDEGANWSAVSTGLRDILVLSLCITLDGRGDRDLIAGTNGYGVWRRPLSDMVLTDVQAPTNHPAAAAPELSVQPNPARDQVLVRYDSQGEIGNLELYNVYGARVLSAEAHASGIALFDVSQLPAGMYLLLLRSGAETAARRVMVVR
ncbi:MAG: T9SS type A sorting domain-containing protein [Ignavibacteria bacterium]|nr:T9SS type A sorting domain-containing protein [Ignavibacteria bacterium]